MDIVYPDKDFVKFKEKFPELTDAQIKNIIYYGVRALFMMSYYNVDVKCQQGKFFAYFGELFHSPDSYMEYRRAKLTAKYRVLYSRSKTPFSGKYYFLLTDELHQKMPKKKKGGEFPLPQIFIYKIREEAELHEGSHLYEIDWPEDVGYKKLIDTESISHYKYIAKRETYKKFIPICEEDKEKTVKRSLKKGGT